jgi:hypothetical protein
MSLSLTLSLTQRAFFKISVVTQYLFHKKIKATVKATVKET